jgi:hypothetical protein
MNGENKPFVQDYSKYTILAPGGIGIPTSCRSLAAGWKPVGPTGKMLVLL